ncbi:RING-H2 finger protein ATL11 [Manihot esculenta]|uniref:Uncharacterized protein n=1 Tax=Manihot esculenta TaxID=3983 RepID=A0ACB7I7N4_MANES|nr:RING-H2 finger protein ATL11 [Manihot esculenta]KAG8660351.1 hypothetical protein MANES_02G148400v8 [Manihot esculenta]
MANIQIFQTILSKATVSIIHDTSFTCQLMTTPNLRPQLYHGLLLKLLLFLFTSPFTVAQRGTLASSSPQQSIDPFSQTPQFNPSLAILMIIIVGAFFLMARFSVYIRQCSERRFLGGNFNPASQIFGRGRWSRREQQGLDTAVIETFPTFLYSTVKVHKIGERSLECAICLNEFEDDQTLRLIPKCSHVFHPDCIDAWLASHITCPVCRANLVPRLEESAFDSAQLFETGTDSVEPDQHVGNVREETQNNVLIHASDGNDRNRRESPDVILLNTTAQNRPRRSWSTGWRLGKLFPRSRSTGNFLVQPVENFERFTLRLPEDVRSQLMNSHLNRTKSCVAFPRATSARRSYRSRSGGSWRSKNYFYYERYEREERPDRWGFTVTPFISRSGSIPRSKQGGSGSGDQVNAPLPKNPLKSVQSPLDRLLQNSSNNKAGEGLSDRLREDVSDNQA